MRKHEISLTPPIGAVSGETWLDVERTASVEVTSEENGYPIESALLGTDNRGWRAASPGTQIIRLIFDEPQKLRRIWLVFEDGVYGVPQHAAYILTRPQLLNHLR